MTEVGQPEVNLHEEVQVLLVVEQVVAVSPSQMKVQVVAWKGSGTGSGFGMGLVLLGRKQVACQFFDQA